MHFDGRWGSQEVADVQHNALLTFKWLHDPDTHSWALTVAGEAIDKTAAATTRPLSLYHHIVVDNNINDDDKFGGLRVDEPLAGVTRVRGAYPARSALRGQRWSAFLRDSGTTSLAPYSAAVRAAFPALPDRNATHWFGTRVDAADSDLMPALADAAQLA